MSASPLPPLYAEWMTALLGGAIPSEPHATCDACAMASDGSDSRAAGEFFDPAVKCCSYTPVLPNYLVGRVLSDRSAAGAIGRASVLARIRDGKAVTPLGLQQPPTYKVLYEQTAQATFGRSLTLRCPHYVDQGSGVCGIWRHRASVCATWFCKHERGATGERFWMALHHLLTQVEKSLSQWCAVELDIDDAALTRLFPPATLAAHIRPPSYTLDDVVRTDAGRSLWGRWSGHEEAFFEACARKVESLSWSDIPALGGVELRVSARLARAAYVDLVSVTLPSRLTLAPFQIVEWTRDRCRVKTYSVTDLLDLPRALVDALRYFDGRPTTAVLDDIEASEGIRLDPALVRQLVDFRILAAPART